MSGILGWIQIFMRKNTKRSEAIHTWLLMLKASQSIARYLLPPIVKAGLGDSDFRLLEVLLHKGPMPVNAIGPKVNLNPGSVSVAVDRLYKKGFVRRVESEDDRRVRTVSLTEKGREMFVPLFRQHAALVQQAFQDVSPEEQKQIEDVLKRIGKRADRLASSICM
jgi:MarR family 2-MHQ and catechol resistance regulon transcriptional repressor